jgi:ferredoxin
MDDSKIKIILEKCTGCTLCVRICPFGAIKVENKKAVIDLSKCNLCGACVDSCKFAAIVLDKGSIGYSASRRRASYRRSLLNCSVKGKNWRIS